MRHGKLLREGETLCGRAAQTVWSGDRLRGLLGRSRVDDDEALWITRCNAVHTIGMRIPIDIVLLARDGSVLTVHGDVGPGRFRMHWRARAVVELAAGRAGALSLHAGQRLQFVAHYRNEVLS